MTQKENYIKKFQAQLEKLRMELEKLEANSNKFEANDKLALRVYIKELRETHNIALAKPHGFLDYMTLVSKLSRFSQLSSVCTMGQGT